MYTLVLDEVIDVLRFLNVSRSDIELLLEAKLIAVDENGRVEWLDDNYSGTFNDIREEIRSSCVILSENKLMVWTLPTELFLAFDTVYVHGIVRDELGAALGVNSRIAAASFTDLPRIRSTTTLTLREERRM